MQIMPPETLAWWTKTLRAGSSLSQDALAVASNLTMRTIQRVEAGDPSSQTTRRSLARGLGYDNVDVFDDPETVKKICDMRADIDRLSREAQDAQFPDRVRLPATRISTGTQLGRLAEDCNGLNCHWDDALEKPAKEAAAAVFDYLRDYMDGSSDCSMSVKLSVYEELDSLLQALHDEGVIVHSTRRPVQFVGDNWQNKTPVRMTIGYVVVDTKDKEIQEIWAAKRFQFA